MVASGDHLLDINGKHYPEQGRLGAPTNLEAIRLVCWWAGMNSTHELLQADVTGTYLQSKLGPTLWPESWRNRGLKRPVLRLRRALYGLQRSGFDWAEKGHDVLSAHGWQVIPDVVMYMLQMKGQTCILALYVDDTLTSSPRESLRESLKAIRRVNF